MNISIKRKKLYIESDNLNEIESHQLIGWTPNYLKGYASMNLDIQALCNLLKQTSEKPKATEEVKTWYQKEIEKNKLALNQKRAKLDNLNKELKEYQLEAVNYFLNMRNCIIGYDMGLGKTLIAINCIKAIKAYKTMIVCPSYLKYSWGDEIKKWSPGLTYTIIDGTPEQREQQFKEHQEQKRIILIINYEQIRVKTKKNGKVIEINVHEYIQKTKFDLVIWDEAHRLKSRDSQISKGAYAINAQNRLMLTGTPITKNPGEIYSPLKILDRQRFTSYWTFVKYYCHVYEGFRDVLVIGDIIRPKEFKDLLSRYMIRKLKEDVAKELPEKIYIDIPVHMNIKQTKYYNDALEDYLNPSGDIIESDVEKFIRICQIVQNPVILGGYDVSCVKDATINLCDDIGEQRIMVACTYIEMSKNLQKSLETKYPGRNVYLINSQVRNRHEIVEKFKEDDTAILVTTIKCLAEGANLDCCDYIIYADIEWNCGVNLQFEDRIHRMTSTRTKFYYFIIVQKTVHQYKHNKIMSESKSAKFALGDSDSKVIRRIMEDFRKELT
jgi:non-specific serine/threonine protein kinase